MHAALNAVQEAVFILDDQRCVIFTNNIAEAYFGDDFIGNDFVQVIRHPECIKIIESVQNGKKTASTIVSIERPIKAEFNIKVTILSEVFEQNNQEKKILVSLKDVSDLREAEKMRTDFVANVSHELRSPLTALAGFIETLRGAAKDDPAARERFLDLMNHEATRMVHMISDLLSLSKVEALSRMRPTGRTNVDSLLKRIITTLGELAEQEKTEVKLEISTPNAVVEGNEEELTQVFQNLVENAIKYGAPNTIVKIEVGTLSSAAGISGATLVTKISDTGEGIAKEHIARLTERFYRVDTHRSRDKGGTGLGLAIVKHIINRHRGRLQIKSTVGIGSTFIVQLPVKLS